MARLPTPGGDNGNWGDILNEYLSVSLSEGGNLKDSSVGTAQLKDGSVTGSKLAVGAIDKSTVGLGNVDNTSDANKPVSSDTQTELDKKVTGPTTATDKAIPRYDSTTGKLLQNTSVTILDTGEVDIATNGSLAAPAISFGQDNSGFYRYGADQIGIGTGGVAAGYFATIGTNAALYMSQSSSGDTAAGNPTFSYVGETNTGMYLRTTNTLGFSTNGVSRLTIDGAGVLKLASGLSIDSAARLIPTGNFIVRSTGGVHYFQNGDGTITHANITLNGIRFNSGTVARAGIDSQARVSGERAGIFQGQTSQSVNILEIQNSSSTPVSYFDSVGMFNTTQNVKIDGNVALNGTALQAGVGLVSAQSITDPTVSQTAGSFSRSITLTAAGAQTIAGGTFNVSLSANAFNQTGKIYGSQSQVLNSNTATVSDVRASHSLLYNVGIGTIAQGVGSYIDIQNLVAGGTITNAFGVRVEVNFNNGTIANTYGLYVGDVTSGTQTNQAYSLYVSDPNARNYIAGTQTTLGGFLSHSLTLAANGNSGLRSTSNATSAVANVNGGDFVLAATQPTGVVSGNAVSGQVNYNSSSVSSGGVLNGLYSRLLTNTATGTGSINQFNAISVAGPTANQSAAAYTLTLSAGLRIDNQGSWANSTSSTVTTAYGIYISDQSGSTSANHGIYFQGATTGNGGGIVWAGDTNLYRGGSNILKSDDSLVLAGSLSTGYIAKTAGYTLALADSVVDITSGTHTQTLHTAVGNTGARKTIKNNGTGVVTVATTSAQTIDGAATYTLSAQYKYVTVVSNGANWMIVSNN